ncbi:MAG: alpha-L-fucosidase [Abditibacteriota bacterium]|nr:alpha-L-fucosidase [Abditibacteriota bacterium]
MNWHDNVDFGIHYDIHANKNNTELGSKLTYDNLKQSLEIIKPDWIQCDCKGHAGYTSWPTEVGFPSPGIVKDALKIHSQVCHDLGIKLGMHYSGVFDIACLDAHPDWEVKDPEGNRWGKTILRSVCQNSPYYDEYMIPQLMEIIEKYDVDGFWVDGDGWSLMPCYCDRCREDFKAKYGIDAPTDRNDPNWHTFAWYHRKLFMANTKKVADAVHNKKPECLYISNWLYTYGAPLDEEPGTDYISGDLNPTFGQMSALLEGHFLTNRQRDWDLMTWGFSAGDANITRETKSILHLTQECALILSAGGACMIYDRPWENGLLNDWTCNDYGKISKFVKDRADISRHSNSVRQIGVIINPDDYFDDTKVLPNLLDLNIKQPFMRKGIGASQLLSENHYHFDIFTPSMIKGKLDDFQLIIINDQYRFDDEFIKNISEYVEKGGKVIISGLNAGRVFGDLLGVKDDSPLVQSEKMDENFNPVRSNTWFNVEVNDRMTGMFCPYSHVESTEAEVYKYVIKSNWKVDESAPFITFNKYGKGVAVGIYSEFFTNYQDTNFPQTRALFDEIMKKLSFDFIIKDFESPFYVFYNLREKDEKLIVNLVNTGSVSSSIDRPFMVEDIPSANVKFKIKIDKEPKNVELVPNSTNIAYEYSDGYLTVYVKDLYIMESVVIDL